MDLIIPAQKVGEASCHWNNEQGGVEEDHFNLHINKADWITSR